MKLWHFSDNLVDKLYSKEQQINSVKPSGLWVSDETDYGWAKWARDCEVTWINGALVYEIEVDLTDILYLSSIKDIKALPCEDTYPNSRYLQGDKVDWVKLAENWKGILITPYQWNCRLTQGTAWYYTWDCASGCIWDISCVTSINLLGQYGMQSSC